MTMTEDEIANVSRAVASRFEMRLRPMVQELSVLLAPALGARMRHLRPSTSMRVIAEWMHEERGAPASSLDWVEWVMAIEDATSSQMVDEFANDIEERSFGEVVEHLCGHRRTA